MEHNLQFMVPGEPVPAPRPRTVTKGGKTWTYSGNKPYRDWTKAIKKAYLDKCKEKHDFESAMLRIMFITDKNSDIDNLLKGVLDALTGVLWSNDKVVWNVAVCRMDGYSTAPYTEIKVTGSEPNHKQTEIT